MFRFSLQELMDFRREKLEACERAYLQANQELQAAQGRLQQLREERRGTVATLREKQRTGISPGESWIYQNYLEELDLRAFDLGAVVRGCEERVQHRRTEYLAAQRDVEVMEELREDEWRGYQYKERKQEDKMMDELAIFKFRGRMDRDS